LEQFLLRVDKGLAELLAPRDRPMVVAAVERELAMYRKVSDHPHLAKTGVEGNPEHVAPEDLHAKALAILEPTLDRARREAVALVNDKAHPDRVVAGLAETLGALENARIGTLVIRSRPAIWGRYDARAGVELAGDGATPRGPEDRDLLDEAVHRAIESGAGVFVAEEGELPNHTVAAGALRF